MNWKREDNSVLSPAVLALAMIVLSALPASAFDGAHARYAAVLREHLRGGLVDYKALKAAPAELDAYLAVAGARHCKGRSGQGENFGDLARILRRCADKEHALFVDLAALAAVKPAEYEAWPRADKIAFWINTYNAYTLKAILDHYPIKPNWRASLRYPKSSIRQVPGVWDKLKFRVMGRELTLDGMEHDILRKQFNEPRAHMALVCASLGCPVLRPEPYTGAALDAQLDDQARRFLADPAKFRLDREKGAAYFSPIFKWFAEDFEPSAAAFMARYVSAQDRAFLESGEFKVKWLDYGWALNEAPPAGEKE